MKRSMKKFCWSTFRMKYFWLWHNVSVLRRLLLTLALLSVLLLTLSILMTNRRENMKLRIKMSIDNIILRSPPRNKLILFYTPMFGEKPWDMFGLFDNYKTQCGCSMKNCAMTYNNTLFKQSDAVIFHGRDLPPTDELLALNRRRPDRQLWVYFIMENPSNSPLIYDLPPLFNLTSTYRVASPLRVPYNDYRALNNEEKLVARKYKNKNYAYGKNKQIGWLVSNCGAPRSHLARKSEYFGLKLHVGGKCEEYYTNKINCTHKKCLNELNEFKFIFAAENGLCKDYVTEKYWNTLYLTNTVPITLGGANYSDPRLAIPGSFINALDFASPLDLVNHLKLLDKNDELYNRYFEWKQYYTIGYSGKKHGCQDAMCELCDKLKSGVEFPAKSLYETINGRECNVTERYFFDEWLNK